MTSLELSTPSYRARRAELETYFDRTASKTWEQLTSTAPVSGVRATVRAGRDAMRAALLSWLPQDLSGARLLDAGCGTGALAQIAAERGAHVVAIDVSASLLDVARRRTADLGAKGAIDFRVGDMLDPALGAFDYVVSMDSLIHYEAGDVADALAGLAARTARAILFTHAPQTPLLSLMHGVGRLFPRGDRAPAIVPLAHEKLVARLHADRRLQGWRVNRDARISSGFYMSHGVELALA